MTCVAFSGRAEDVGPIVSAVRRRSVPAPATLAAWIARRLGMPELCEPLANQFRSAISDAPTPDGPSAPTYSRLFRQYGRYNARDWRALGRLCRYAQSLGSNGGRENRLTLRTASRYVTRYLRAPHQVFAERLGWEWVLETALRVAGYVVGA